MRIKMTIGLCGPNTNLGPGDVADFPEVEALRFIEAGIAVPVIEDKVERAVKPAPKGKETR